MQAKLVVVQPDLKPGEYEVELPLTIGRGREAKLKFSHALISRQHCELYENDGGMMVRDLGSRNGTFIGGQRIETAPLAPGELLTVGGITLRAVYGEDVRLAPNYGTLTRPAAADETLSLNETAQVTFKPEVEEASPLASAEAGEAIDWLDDTAPPEPTQPSPTTDDDDLDDFLQGLR